MVYPHIMQSSVLKEETEKFIESLEEKLGSPMSYRTFCTWYCDSDGNLRDRGVFLCRFSDSIYYEDFEPKNDFIGDILLGRKPSREKYVKMERVFAISDIESIRVVTRSAAESDMRREHREAGFLSRLLSRLVLQLKLRDGTLLFFEAMDRKEFIQALGL